MQEASLRVCTSPARHVSISSSLQQLELGEYCSVVYRACKTFDHQSALLQAHPEGTT